MGITVCLANYVPKTLREGSCDRLQDDAVSVRSMVNRCRLSRRKPFPGSCLEVESLAIPRFLWFKRSLVFRVRRMPAQESSEG